jgi:predicted ATP-grasp superfamily ATP-dependent carboligase
VTTSLPRILAAGVSVRSLARSAIAAGYEVLTADGYGDRDLLEPLPDPVRHLTVAPFEPGAVADHVTMPYDAVAYTSNFENHPEALERLALGRTILGNAPSVLREVRRAERVHEVLEAAGLHSAPVYAGGDAAIRAGGRRLVAKPRRSGGGQGVRHWRVAEPLLDDELLQEWVDGVPASLVFLADGHDAAALGLTRQLIGDPAFGASGQRWCGNLLGCGATPVLDESAAVLASATAAARAHAGIRAPWRQRDRFHRAGWRRGGDRGESPLDGGDGARGACHRDTPVCSACGGNRGYARCPTHRAGRRVRQGGGLRAIRLRDARHR